MADERRTQFNRPSPDDLTDGAHRLADDAPASLDADSLDVTTPKTTPKDGSVRKDSTRNPDQHSDQNPEREHNDAETHDAPSTDITAATSTAATPTNITHAQQWQHYQRWLEHTPEYVLELDRDWTITSVSNTAAAFIGRPPAEVVGICYWDIFPKAHSAFEEHYRQAMDTGQGRSFEAPSHHRIGAWYETRVYPHEQGLSIYARDISDRKRAQKALHQSQGRLELLRQRSPLGIIEWDTDFRILTWNPAAETIFGFSEEEVLGHSTADLLIPQEMRPHITTLISNTVEQKHVTHSINDNLTKSGKIITCEWYNVPLKTDQGTVIGVTGLVQNISQREYAQSKLNRLAEFRRQLIDLSREVLQEDTSDAAALYHHLLEKAITTIPGAQAGSIMLRQDDGYYYFVAAEGYDLEGLRGVTLHESDLHIAPDENSAKVAHNPENYEVASLGSEGNAYFNEIGRVGEIRAMLTVPVVVGNTRQAVLFIDNFVSDDAFDAAAIEMAEIFAGQIGVYLRRLWLESELRERELRSRALLEAIPDTISRHDATGRYIDIRLGLHHASVMSLDDRLGKTVYDIIGDSHPDIAKMFHDAQQHALETRQIQRFEFRFSHQGTWQYREVRVVATDALDVQDARETIVIVRDVTRQKEAEQALRESENRYRIISDVMTDVLYAYKRDNHGSFVRDWNSGVGEVRLTGYEPTEIDALGGWTAIVHPDDQTIIRMLSNTLRPQRLVIEYRIITKSGDIKWVRDFSRAVFDASGKVVIALFGANQDITEQKQAEHALEAAKADLERALDENTLILESITDSFVSLDSNWQLRYVNQRALSYTAFDDVSQVLTRPYVEVFGFAKRLPLERIFDRTLVRNTPEQLEVFWQERDLWLELRIYPNRAGLAIYATDISERKRMEFALTASNRELNRYVSELAALNHMMEVLTSATRVRDALEAVAPLIAQLLNLEGVSISLLDQASNDTLPWSPTDVITTSDATNSGSTNSDIPSAASYHHSPAEDWTDTAILREVVHFSKGQSHVVEHAPSIALNEDRNALSALRDNYPVHVSEPAFEVTPRDYHFDANHQNASHQPETHRQPDTPLSNPLGTQPPSSHTTNASLAGYCKLVLPLRSQHLMMGVLRLSATDSQRTFSNAEIELAETVAGQLASALSNVQLLEAQQSINRDLHHANAQLADAKAQLELKNKRLITLSTRDGLTGIYNRRHLETQLAKEFARVTRYNLPLSVMICDIDNFKKVNDTFSHSIGDDVLRQVAAIMQQHTRDIDIVARYGGEEFVIVFPETKPEDAYEACEKIRLLVANQSWDDLAPGLRVTLSLGLTGHTAVNSHEEMLNRADTLLYDAKHAGKNCIVVDNTPDGTGTGVGGTGDGTHNVNDTNNSNAKTNEGQTSETDTD